MNLHNQVPVKLGHFHKADVSENSRVVDDNVDSSESVNGSLHDFIAELYRIVICDGLTSSLFNFINNDIGRSLLFCLGYATYGATEIIYNDLCATRGK